MDVQVAAAAVLLVAALIGALAGAAGFALLIVGLQNRRARPDRGAPRARRRRQSALLARRGRIRDKRLRAAFAELADRVAQTWELATVDPLTGIANRQAVLARVEEELARAARYRRPLSVILVDLDHFKRVNDSHGHAAGDAILRQVAQLLAAQRPRRRPRRPLRRRGVPDRAARDRPRRRGVARREAAPDRRRRRGPAARRRGRLASR